MQYLTRNRDANGTCRTRETGIDRLFEEMTRGFGLAPAAAVAATEFEPSLDVCETAGEWRVRAELPGVAAQDVEISVTGNVLTVRGEKRDEANVEGETFRRSERRYGKFVRSLEFPTDLDAAKVEARVKNGVLAITLPKAQASLPKTIAVKVE